MYNRSGTQAYAQVSLESGAMSASPHQLIVMLFDGALSALLRARILMNQWRYRRQRPGAVQSHQHHRQRPERRPRPQQGGEIAENLAALYDYMKRRLMQANLHNDEAAIAEVVKLLENIADAWRQIGPNYQPSQDAV